MSTVGRPGRCEAEARGDGRRRQARRRLPSDRLAGDQLEPAGPARDPRARAGGHAEARLPAELGGPRARDGPLEDARRRQLRHDPLRPGLDALRASSAPRTRPATSSASSACWTLDRRLVLDAVERLRSQGVEGILVIAPQTRGRALRAPAPGRPAGRRRRGRPGARAFRVVAVDQVAGAAARDPAPARARPPRRVWHLAGPADWLEAQQRVAGWRAAPRRRPAPSRRRRSSATGARGSGYELGRSLAANRDVTAVFVANDQMALGLLRALHEAGRAVPGDVSVVGFDDIPEAAFFTPPLTTVRQDFTEVGPAQLRPAARRDRARRALAARVTVPPELIVRASTAPHRAMSATAFAVSRSCERNTRDMTRRRASSSASTSARSPAARVVVRASDGAELGTAVHDTARRHRADAARRPASSCRRAGRCRTPRTTVDVLRHAVPAAVARGGRRPGDVVGIATDFTACTPLPVAPRRHAAVRARRVRRPPARVPEALEAPRRAGAGRPHQRARGRARRAVARALRRPDLLGVGVRQGAAGARGGPRGLRRDRALDRGRRLDRLAALRRRDAQRLHGRLQGHLPGRRATRRDDYLRALNPDFADFVRDKLEHPLSPLGGRAGGLTAEAAGWTGLPEGSRWPSATSTPT